MLYSISSCGMKCNRDAFAGMMIWHAGIDNYGALTLGIVTSDPGEVHPLIEANQAACEPEGHFAVDDKPLCTWKLGRAGIGQIGVSEVMLAHGAVQQRKGCAWLRFQDEIIVQT